MRVARDGSKFTDRLIQTPLGAQGSIACGHDNFRGVILKQKGGATAYSMAVETHGESQPVVALQSPKIVFISPVFVNVDV